MKDYFNSLLMIVDARYYHLPEYKYSKTLQVNGKWVIVAGDDVSRISHWVESGLPGLKGLPVSCVEVFIRDNDAGMAEFWRSREL